MTLDEFENVDDVCPLSAIQGGMLYHSLSMNRPSAYFEQHSFVIEGRFDPIAFHDSWQATVDRHPTLRTEFHWDGIDEPLQIVRKEVAIPWLTLDWRTLTAQQQHREFERLLHSDRQRGFQLDEAPLLRFHMAALSDSAHQFLWSFHHLIIDGWSMTRLFRELWNDYRCRREGVVPTHATLRPYRDYLAWLRQYDAETAKSFWISQLRGFHTPTRLPGERRAPADESSDAPGRRFAGRLTQDLSPDATRRIGDFARAHRVTLNTLIQAAWAILLSRYSGQRDVVFGMTVSGRSATVPHAEEIVGPMINTLPMRVDVNPEQGITDWLSQIQATRMAIQQHEHSPLVKVQRWSEVAEGEPLFQSLVVFENIDVSGVGMADVQLRDYRYLEECNYPLAAIVFPNAELKVVLVYDVDRLSHDGVARVLDSLMSILERFPDCGGSMVSSLFVLGAVERHLLTVSWNNTVGNESGDLIHERIERQAQQTPNEFALIIGDRRMSYRELMAAAFGVARQIGAIDAGQPIGLFTDRTPEMIIGMLGILCAGGAYVPIDPTLPAKRIRYLLEDSQTRLVLTTNALAAQLPASRATTLLIDQCDTSNSWAGRRLPSNESRAYLMYTSGSTGMPKGVEVTHRNLVHSTLARLRYYSSTPPMFLQLPSFSFDSSVAVIFWSLCSGGTLVVPQSGEQRDILRLDALIKLHGVTHILTLPSMCDLLFRHLSNEALDGLQTVIVAGEACSIKFIKQHQDRIAELALFNEYGPTEATVWSTVQRVDPYRHQEPVPIGRPITGARAYILDSGRRLVPIGVPGELYIGGAGVCPGYWNRPELTAERFISDPFVSDSKARLYASGDVACYRPDGTLDFLGRIDDQIKIRGHRVEPREIEFALEQHPSVRSAAVVVDSLRPAARFDLDDQQIAQLASRLDAASVGRIFSEAEATPADDDVTLTGTPDPPK